MLCPQAKAVTLTVVRDGGFGMTPRCIVLVCSRRRPLADRHPLPFPWTLSLRRRWCPSASHRPVSLLFPLALSFLLYFPFLSFPLAFPSIGRGVHRPPTTPSLSFPLVACAGHGGGGERGGPIPSHRSMPMGLTTQRADRHRTPRGVAECNAQLCVRRAPSLRWICPGGGGGGGGQFSSKTQPPWRTPGDPEGGAPCPLPLWSITDHRGIAPTGGSFGPELGNQIPTFWPEPPGRERAQVFDRADHALEADGLVELRPRAAVALGVELPRRLLDGPRHIGVEAVVQHRKVQVPPQAVRGVARSAKNLGIGSTRSPASLSTSGRPGTKILTKGPRCLHQAGLILQHRWQCDVSQVGAISYK